MTTVKKSPYDKAFIELWINAKTKKPDLVNKINPNFDTSTILLLHVDGIGVVPGYYLKWNRDFYIGEGANQSHKKGDTSFHSLKDNSLLEKVLFYYPVDKLPLKTADLKPENADNTEKPKE